MFSVRPALASDIPRIIELNDALFRENAAPSDAASIPSVQERAARWTAYLDSETHIIFLAEADGDTCAVGYLAGHIEPPTEYRDLPVAELEGIYIESSMRAEGMEQDLARTFIYWCRAQGVGSISVTTNAINVETIRFYQALGFHPKHISFELNLR